MRHQKKVSLWRFQRGTATVTGIGFVNETNVVLNVNAMPQFSIGYAASPVQAHMANRAKQPKFSSIPGDYQTFCEDFELLWESLGGTTGTDDRQKLHFFKKKLSRRNKCQSLCITNIIGFERIVISNLQK